MAGTSNGCQTWIKYVLVVAVLVTCIYVTLNQTGYFLHRYNPSSVSIIEPQPKSASKSTKQAPHVKLKSKQLVPQVKRKSQQKQTKPPIVVPVVPVLNSDRKEAFPNYDGVPEDVYKTDWWMSAAYLEWDLEQRPRDYYCKNIKNVGNWWICMDEKYKIKKPCLVYSFGIANDFSFDDDMAAHGCEVHSFDPSMKTKDYTRKSSVHFHAIGLSSYTDDKFNPRRDMYVKDNTTWTIMTLNLIKIALGHRDRPLDVLKIDVEGHEWAVIENLLQDKMFPKIRQFMLEYHLFPDWPAKSDYPKVLRTYKRLHDLGFAKFETAMHPLTHIPKKFNIQADVGYVNTKYISSRKKRDISPIYRTKRINNRLKYETK